MQIIWCKKSIPNDTEVCQGWGYKWSPGIPAAIYQKYTENDPELKSTLEQMINVKNHVMSNKDNLDLIISSNIEDALPKVIFSEWCSFYFTNIFVFLTNDK